MMIENAKPTIIIVAAGVPVAMSYMWIQGGFGVSLIDVIFLSILSVLILTVTLMIKA